MAVAAARPALPPQEPLQRPEPAGRRPCAEESAGRGAAPPPRLQPPPPPPPPKGSRALLPFQACVGEDCCAPVSVRPGDSSPRLMKGVRPKPKPKPKLPALFILIRAAAASLPNVYNASATDNYFFNGRIKYNIFKRNYCL
ncbi:GRB2-associated and regulator of MAPK protein 2-like [Bos mutus]|uniref:GRB2-associated and regulator of MAPK protein 2-like n=1 Tax=Bos mutus TaxID=72004 RepID=UPI0038B50F36